MDTIKVPNTNKTNTKINREVEEKKRIDSFENYRSFLLYIPPQSHVQKSKN